MTLSSSYETYLEEKMRTTTEKYEKHKVLKQNVTKGAE